MLIPHPLLGLRDAQEFTYLGDARLIERPDVAGLSEDDALDAMHDYLFLRDNPAGLHRELWFHEQGDRSWLVVTRDTRTHAILGAELASDVARALGRGRGPEAPSAVPTGSVERPSASGRATTPARVEQPPTGPGDAQIPVPDKRAADAAGGAGDQGGGPGGSGGAPGGDGGTTPGGQGGEP